MHRSSSLMPKTTPRSNQRLERSAILALLLTLVSSACGLAQTEPQPQVIMDRAVADFEQGLFDQAATGFDEVARLNPNFAPQLWQRGIALYYAERWQDCISQFELHRTVNPNDVENAVWHYLCVARMASPGQARDGLLPVGPDQRVPMTEIYAMFRGDLAPSDILAAASDTRSTFFANLYLGLYFEAQGDTDQALEYIRNAADPQYENAGGYMHMVARVHLNSLAP